MKFLKSFLFILFFGVVNLFGEIENKEIVETKKIEEDVKIKNVSESEYLEKDTFFLFDDDLFPFVENFTTHTKPFSLNGEDKYIFKGNKKKKRQKTAVLLHGISRLFHSAGKIATSQTSKEQAKEVCDFAGGTFGMFAQLSALDAAYCQEEQNEQTKDIYKEALLYLVVPQINYFYELLKQSGVLLSYVQFPLLTELFTFGNVQERFEWIIKTLLSNELVQKLLEEIINCIQTYLHDKFPIIVDILANYLKESLLELFNKIAEEQKIDETDKLVEEKKEDSVELANVKDKEVRENNNNKENVENIA